MISSYSNVVRVQKLKLTSEVMERTSVRPASASACAISKFRKLNKDLVCSCLFDYLLACSFEIELCKDIKNKFELLLVWSLQ